MKSFDRLVILLALVAIIGFGFTHAFAGESGVDMEIQDDSFGSNYQCTWIPSYSFFPYSSNTEWIREGEYLKFTSATHKSMVASINLPSGAFLNIIELFYYDFDPGYITMTVYEIKHSKGGLTQLGEFTSSGTPGFTSGAIYPNHTIANADNIYSVSVYASAATTNLKFMGVRLTWKRQVSPPPSSATFSDVPPSHMFFQYVEALAQSRITSGCGGGNFCPDMAVTRGQMAVFLSRALGLHWDLAEGY